MIDISQSDFCLTDETPNDRCLIVHRGTGNRFGHVSANTSLSLRRWIGLIGLLLVEGLVLSELFDVSPFLADRRWWVVLLAFGPRGVGRLVIAVAITMLLVAGRQFREAFDHASGTNRRSPAWLLLVANLAFAGFGALTIVITRGGLGTAAHPGGWAVAWVTMGAITLGTWIAELLPVGFVRALGRRGAARFLLVVTVAATALWAGQAYAVALWSPLDRSPLVRMTFWTAFGLIGVFSSDPICQPEQALVGTRYFAVRIGPPCSGYEGMGLILVLLGAYLALCRRSYRFPHALLLIPLGVAAMWVANVVRIALLVAVGVWISPIVAMKGFHTQAGWLAFNGISLGLVLASRHIRFFTVSDPRVDAAESRNPTAAYIFPLLAIVATMMFTGALTEGFDRFYPLRVLAAGAALWYFRRNHSALRWTWSWTAVAIGAGAFALWMALEPEPAASTGEIALGMGLARLGPVWGPAWFTFRVVGSVVTVPIAEELAFRGYLARRLIAADFQDVPPGRFTWLSFIVSSAVFGALHDGRWLAGVLAGMLYAIALYRRRELSDAVVAHATTNALIAGYVTSTGDLSLWA